MSDLAAIKAEATDAIAGASSMDALEEVRIAYLGKSGVISSKMKTIGTLPVEERKAFGASLNTLKDEITTSLEHAKRTLENASLTARLAEETADITLPIRLEAQGHIHPITHVIEEIITLFSGLGFTVAEGPEIEDDWHNFTALNIPPSHPARQMHDTFYFPEQEDGERLLLRTHTSPVQIRVMQQGEPPFRVIAPGRTYRCDSDITHTPMFHQVEGLYVDETASMAQLKFCLQHFVEHFFERSDVPLRFRPSFFPFTEPSAEVDIGCKREGSELIIGPGEDWLEILGCGMVHPNVLKNVGIDPEKYSGFAFGMGVERLAMLKYGIPDLRTFFESDIRWLSHYGFDPLAMPGGVGT